MGLLSGLRFSGDEPKRKKTKEKEPPKVGLWYPQQQQEQQQEQQEQREMAPAVVVGDGGASHRAACLRRATEEAKRTGRDLEDVVADRYGSLEELTLGKSIDETLALERSLPRVARRRRPHSDLHRSEPGGLTDAQVLAEYAEELEQTTIDLGKRGRRRDKDDDDGDLRRTGGGSNGWTGMPTTSAFTMGRPTFQGRSWRDPASEEALPESSSSSERKRPKLETPPAAAPALEGSHQDSSSNANVAARLREKLGGS
mmetsp:Transcript_13209/g.43053  ORF Transcript_13209/g.43053 Transcript_13209/m.43053 type:complete len:256 (+) Transcript_13209:41-808(+)